MVFDLFVQRVAIDSKSSRGSGLHTLTLTQHLQQQFLFNDVHHFIIDVRTVVPDLRQSAADKIAAKRIKVFSSSATDANRCQTSYMRRQQISRDLRAG